MKKNIARYVHIAAVVFFLGTQCICADVQPVSPPLVNAPVAPSFARVPRRPIPARALPTPLDEILSPSQINTLALDEALGESQSVEPALPQAVSVPAVIPADDAVATLSGHGASQQLQQPVVIVNSLGAATQSSLIQLMTQIESSLKNIENAVSAVPGASSKPDAKTGDKADVVVIPSKPSQSTAASNLKTGAMADDVDVSSKDLDELQKISDETPLISEHGNNIKLGASMPLTGSMALVGRDYLTGINLVFDKFNRAGGLDKKHLIKYSTVDDRYLSTVAKENVLKSVKESPFFIGNFGSHLLATIKDLLEKKNALMLFPTVGEATFHTKEYRYLVNLRPSMKTELRALINYAVNSQQRKKIAIFYEENQWGKDGASAVDKALGELGLQACAKSSYPANTIAVVSAATDIIKSKPDAVICISTYRPTYNFIQLVLNEGFQHCLFLGLGPSTPMQQLLKKSRGVSIATTSVVPDPVKSKLPIVQAYRKDMAKYFPLRELSQYSLEGYIAGSIFVSALKQIDAPYTVGKLIAFFEGLSKKDFGGFKINFNPETRELSSRVWINNGGNAEWDDSFCDAQEKS